MPDLVIRHIDMQLAERIKTLAKERQWSINDVVLNALRSGLGLSAAGQIFTETMLDPGDLVLAGHWESAERAVFQEAVQALSTTAPTQFAPEQG
ncbi:hypothetical protein [Frateuria defendens]|uniref:hypothetical protein n=1 Tax=Frateuria defendens TaxID=2219559 RepID=UPI00066FC4DC|nr:hypothetical protein [Frateuria defendens]